MNNDLHHAPVPRPKPKKWAKKNFKKNFFGYGYCYRYHIRKFKIRNFFFFKQKNKMPDVVIPLYFI